MARYTTRPLTDRTWLNPRGRGPSRFTSTWVDTEDLLMREIDMLGGKHVAIGVDVSEVDFRLNGELRARARAASPAIEVAFDSKHGPLLYRCDSYEGGPYYNKMESWQHNARAIALTLEALRAVDRHGSSHSGEQYKGFKAIESGRSSGFSSVPEAVAWLSSEEALGFAGGQGLSIKAAYRAAARIHHPDAGGDPAKWALVNAAHQLLEKDGML